MSKTTTAPTPTTGGRWVVPRFGVPSVLEWQPFTDKPTFGNYNPDRLSSLPTTLTGNHVLARIITAGAAGPDNIQRAGGYPSPRTAQPGFTPGHDFVGEIIALGPDASAAYAADAGKPSATLKVGEIVASDCLINAHATHIIIEATNVLKLDPKDDPVKIVALPLNYMTAYGMLRRTNAPLPPGSSILIGSASGGVGTAIAQLAHTFDMKLNMIGTCSPSKMEYVRSLGVTPVDRFSDVAGEVRKLTGDKGVDVAFDAVGSKESLTVSRAATKDGTGQVIMIGIMDDILEDGSGMRQPQLGAQELLAERLGERMQFFSMEAHYSLINRKGFREDFDAIAQKVREGELDPVVSKLFKLSEAVHVNELLVHGGGVKGKMVYVVDGDVAKEKGLSP